MVADIRYVKNGGVAIAYQVIGSGDGYDGCSMAALYAATFPERTRALVLFQPRAQAEATDETHEWLRELRERWGTVELHEEQLAAICPSLAETDEGREWFVNDRRVGASPAVAYELNLAWVQTDIRDVLAAIRVPTLVLHRGARGHAEAQDVARRIPDSRISGLSGEDWWGIFL